MDSVDEPAPEVPAAVADEARRQLAQLGMAAVPEVVWLRALEQCRWKRDLPAWRLAYAVLLLLSEDVWRANAHRG